MLIIVEEVTILYTNRIVLITNNFSLIIITWTIVYFTLRLTTTMTRWADWGDCFFVGRKPFVVLHWEIYNFLIRRGQVVILIDDHGGWLVRCRQLWIKGTSKISNGEPGFKDLRIEKRSNSRDTSRIEILPGRGYIARAAGWGRPGGRNQTTGRRGGLRSPSRPGR